MRGIRGVINKLKLVDHVTRCSLSSPFPRQDGPGCFVRTSIRLQLAGLVGERAKAEP